MMLGQNHMSELIQFSGDSASIRNQPVEKGFLVHIECASGDEAYEVGRTNQKAMLGSVRAENAPQYRFTREDSLVNLRAADLRGIHTYPHDIHMKGLGGNDHQYLIASSEVTRTYEADGIETVRAPESGVACLTVTAGFHEQSGQTVESATEAAYTKLFEKVQELRMHPLRIWNYMPNINDGADSEGNGASELYKQFNAGRHKAWQAYDPDFSEVCSATGIGNTNPYKGIDITCLATKHPVIHLDNPNQIPFLQYDAERFGVQPCSRRGTIHLTPGGIEIYISGTASITGQDNRFAGDIEPKDIRMQTRQTLENIQALVSQENLAAYVSVDQDIPEYQLADLKALRVYIRNEEDLPIIQEELEAAGIPANQIMYLKADICRKLLDIEIEAMIV